MPTSTNTALQIYGADRITRRLNALRYTPSNRNILRARLRATLGKCIRALVQAVLRVCPVITGRLYRSFRFKIASDHISLTFQAPYAWWVEWRSKRNRKFFDRGIRAGVREANRIGANTGQSGVKLVWKRMGKIERVGTGKRAGMTVKVGYQGIIV